MPIHHAERTAPFVVYQCYFILGILLCFLCYALTCATRLVDGIKEQSIDIVLHFASLYSGKHYGKAVMEQSRLISMIVCILATSQYKPKSHNSPPASILIYPVHGALYGQYQLPSAWWLDKFDLNLYHTSCTPDLRLDIDSGWDSDSKPEYRHSFNPYEYYGPQFDKWRYIPKIYYQFLNIPSSYSSVNSSEATFDFTMTTPIYTGAIPTDNTPVIIDPGATFSCTPFIEDIVPDTIEHVDLSVKNLSGHSAISAKGFGRWSVMNVHGNVGTLEPYMHVVPQSEVRLFSLQDYFQ